MSIVRFLVGMASAVVIVVALLALIAVIDPTGRAHARWPALSRLCAPGIWAEEPAALQVQALHQRPEDVFFGNSRVLLAFGQDSIEPLAGNVVMNMAISGSTLEDIEPMFQVAASSGRLRRAWIGLDYGMFAVPTDGLDVAVVPQGAWHDLQASARIATIASGLVMLWDHQACVRPLRDVRGFQSPETELASIGEIGWERTLALAERSMRSNFQRSAALSARGRQALAERQWVTLRGILHSARVRDIQLILWINPSHASYLRIVREAGLGRELAAWRREIAAFSRSEGVAFFDWLEFPAAHDADLRECSPLKDSVCPMRDLNHARWVIGRELLAKMVADGAVDRAVRD